MSVQAYEARIKELRKRMQDDEAELSKRTWEIGRELATNERFSSLAGWSKAHELSRDIQAARQRIETVEQYQQEMGRRQVELEELEKKLKQLDHKHRIALIETGRVAYHQYLLGSPTLSQYAGAFAALQELDERIRAREGRAVQDHGQDTGWIGKLRAGTSSLVNRFQGMLEEGRKRAMLQELGREMVRLGLVQRVLSKQDPHAFELFLSDLEEWEGLYRQQAQANDALEAIKANPAETGYPFAATLRDLRRLTGQLEERTRTVYPELWREWKAQGYHPEAEGDLEQWRSAVETLLADLQDARQALEKAELGLQGEKLLEQARRNREHGEKLIAEGQALLRKADEQDAEARELLRRAES